jgi:hypothetical protein
MTMVSTASCRRTDPATLGEEEVGPNTALAPLYDYAFLQLLVIRQVPKLCTEGKGDDSPMPDVIGLVGHAPEMGVVVPSCH